MNGEEKENSQKQVKKDNANIIFFYKHLFIVFVYKYRNLRQDCRGLAV